MIVHELLKSNKKHYYFSVSSQVTLVSMGLKSKNPDDTIENRIQNAILCKWDVDMEGIIQFPEWDPNDEFLIVSYTAVVPSKDLKISPFTYDLVIDNLAIFYNFEGKFPIVEFLKSRKFSLSEKLAVIELQNKYRCSDISFTTKGTKFALYFNTYYFLQEKENHTIFDTFDILIIADFSLMPETRRYLFDNSKRSQKYFGEMFKKDALERVNMMREHEIDNMTDSQILSSLYTEEELALNKMYYDFVAIEKQKQND